MLATFLVVIVFFILASLFMGGALYFAKFKRRGQIGGGCCGGASLTELNKGKGCCGCKGE